jgi:putative transposase
MSNFEYRGGFRYHVVFVTHRRRRVLVGELGHRAARLLARFAQGHGFDLEAYCIMPDHVHALIAGDAARESDLHTVVHRFKQRLGYEFKSRTGQSLWQRSYYDHVLRPNEQAQLHAAYIIANPVRAGLVATPSRWPLSGPDALFHAEADRSEDLSLRFDEVANVLGFGRRPRGTV